VRVPTTVVSGAWDLVVPPSVSASIAAAIPGSELVTVARTGHFIPRDAPDVVAAAARAVESRARAGVRRSEDDTPS
jgi:pimeloyl-ACP methyl ester carboxylesterase